MAAEIISKRCSKCKEIKPTSEFNKNRVKNDGLQIYCRSCQRQYHQTERGKEVNRKGVVRYFKTEKGKTTTKRYHQSEKGKARDKRFCIRHPEQRKANDAVNHAIRAGKLPRANTKLCHYCPKPAQQYHHPSYAPEHWLDVVPVCIKCHSRKSR